MCTVISRSKKTFIKYLQTPCRCKLSKFLQCYMLFQNRSIYPWLKARWRKYKGDFNKMHPNLTELHPTPHTPVE